jgi:hypothetical protein
VVVPFRPTTGISLNLMLFLLLSISYGKSITSCPIYDRHY